MKQATKLSITLALAFVASLAMAPILDNGGQQFHGEQSQEQLAQQQGLQGSYDQVGEVIVDTDDEDYRKESQDDNARNTLASLDADAANTKNLQEAEKGLAGGKKSGSRFWVFAGLFAVIGAAGFAGFKKFMDKATPEMPTPKTVRW